MHKNKRVFKIMHYDVFQVILVICGYSQVLRVNFLENYLLLVNDIMFGILLLMAIHFGFLAKIVNLESAFLYKDL